MTSFIEKQLTFAPHGHVLTNVGVWSPDGQWIAYDVRPDPAGAVFTGDRIERVNVQTNAVELLYQTQHGAHCGVATCSPTDQRVAFILGPERPTPDWTYAVNRRQGVIVDSGQPALLVNLDARDLTPPFTPGALRGGSHVHVFSGDGQWVSFTYQDHVLEHFQRQTRFNDVDLRNVGVSVPMGPVHVSTQHPRNQDGAFFSVLVTRTTAQPTPGSDQIQKAFEDAWVGVNGYIKRDGTRQKRAIAFQGEVVTASGQTIAEVFIADLPADVTVAPEDGPLQGTEMRRPLPPRGTVQRRLTHTADRTYPGLQGPRHWVRSSPDGSRIAFLMKDDAGVVQLWTISPNGGEPVQVSRHVWPIASAFTWSPDGRWIAHAMDNSVFVTEVETGHGVRVTLRSSDADAPRPEACVFSPNGKAIAYTRGVRAEHGATYNQVFVTHTFFLEI